MESGYNFYMGMQNGIWSFKNKNGFLINTLELSYGT